MPDWCDTRMTIEGPKDQVENIRKLILQWTSKNYTKNDFGHGWLGNVVLGAGFSYGGENGLSCRGSITEIGEVEEKEPGLYYFQLYYISAWEDVSETWQIILEKFAPSCKMYYCAEELEGDFSITNDKNKRYYEEECIIDSYLEETNPMKKKWNFDEWEYIDRKTLKEKLSQIFGSMTLPKLIEKAKNIPVTNEEWVKIHMIEYV